ncbi:DUF3558 domain-containing protein [Corynebacterium alimapuense]|uniref:DUF3558 domain-containing protein n=1 Tax=Corynebacterium alimapuense TaxID=1576874 RepID=A0A3M8K9M4_9CORY|nr:DUF3558 domain-containing protein [Corynebacterium alimapuense]RNE49599.1 hypothetical protein C5L39_04455 [Corynebacterium alimapuense]
MPARRFLVLAVSTVVLSACSTSAEDSLTTEPTDPPESVASSAPTTAVAQESLELGEFDPEGDFELFDPCTEIPSDVLVAAGMGEAIWEPGYDRDLSVRCGFSAVDYEQNLGTFALTADRNTKEKLFERNLMIAEDIDSSIPGAYLHQLSVGNDSDCHAAVHTERGRFIVNYGEISTDRSLEEICGIALDQLEFLYEQMGEENGYFY